MAAESTCSNAGDLSHFTTVVYREVGENLGMRRAMGHTNRQLDMVSVTSFVGDSSRNGKLVFVVLGSMNKLVMCPEKALDIHGLILGSPQSLRL